MKTLAWSQLGACTLLLAFGCGSGQSRASGGRPDASVQETGVGGGGAGGGSGSGGSGGKSGSTKDVTPPVFAGISKIDVIDQTSVEVSWAAATDDHTAAAQIAYRVYRASTKGGEDFKGTRRCGSPLADAGPFEESEAPCFVAAATGATSAVVPDAFPAHTFYFVARAFDASGNEDTNDVEVSATSPDQTAPSFGGVRALTAESAHSILVEWGAGYDIAAADSQLVFSVFASVGVNPDPSTDTPAYKSKPGEHSTLLTALPSATGPTPLLPQTTYNVMVRSTDPAGNEDANTRVLSVVTPEGVPPAFDGARLASSEGTTVRVFWLPGTDNATEAQNIIYDVWATTQGPRTENQNTAPPTYTSEPGASSIVIPNLEPGTRYYFIVRAQDSAGNRDSNTKEVQTTTGGLLDTTPPTFNGVNGVTSLTPRSLQVTWGPAADDTSLTPDQFTYLVYYSTASTVPLKTPALTLRGVTSATLLGLVPDTNYNVVVIAKDGAGNASTNVTTLGGTTLAPLTPDGGASSSTPVVGGNPTVGVVTSPPSRLNVSWPAASGEASPNVRFHLCVSATATDCQGASFISHVAATTGFGVKAAPLNYLDPRTQYGVFVRAEDRAGNLETGDHTAQAVTATSWSKNVSSILFDRCIACHDFEQPAAIINVRGSATDPAACPPQDKLDSTFGACQLKLIDPFRPQFSIIYRRVNLLGLETSPFSATVPNNYEGPLEPRDTADKLSGDERDVLLDWINQGALAN